MTSTFLQPSWVVFSWSAARYDRELSDMRGVGIRSVIAQWTVDMDANEAYYAAPADWYARGADMVGSLLASAGRHQMSVWLGLGNVYDWQSHAADEAWLENQLRVNQRIADQLWALYPGKIAGWYISNEVDDLLLSTPAAIGPMTSFFTRLTDYLHTHAGKLPVMTSPTYSGLRQSPAQFAQSVKKVLGAVDVLNVQDGGGSGYIGPSDISNWFSAMSAALAGTRTALWHDADMYASPSGPMDPARLQANLKATCGYVAARTGFSFTTQMSPASLGTSYYYDAYKAYVSST
ncbi:MAG: DUF4434 domain-containing protein [Actinobacteria bacterium]|nr:DUF4434 domain-containing protein [Actinomycetota bacterium]